MPLQSQFCLSLSRYVLLHHVMGGLEGVPGAWGYVQGGMGALSDAIAKSATAYGASIFTNKVNIPSSYTPVIGRILGDTSSRHGGPCLY